MSSVSAKRVKTKKQLENAIEDAETEGYKVESKSDRVVTLKKHGGFGGPLGHGLVFVFFGWWTFLIANVVYAGYRHITGAKTLKIKME